MKSDDIARRARARRRRSPARIAATRAREDGETTRCPHCARKARRRAMGAKKRARRDDGQDDSVAVETFVSMTGCDEALARRRLRAVGFDLPRALDAHFAIGEAVERGGAEASTTDARSSQSRGGDGWKKRRMRSPTRALERCERERRGFGRFGGILSIDTSR